MSAPQIGTGTTITFGTTNFVANIVSADVGEVKRDSKDSTYLGTTTAKTYIPVTLYDSGELGFKAQFDAANGTNVPIAHAAETITIAFAGGHSVAGTGFMTGYKITVQTEDIIMADFKVKFSGALTWS